MNDKKFMSYVINTINLVKGLAIKAKKDVDNPKKGFKDYSEGIIMGYYSIITLLKHQAFAFCIDQKKLGLVDINPDVDLLGLHRNLDIDFGENNWKVDALNEEKIKGYLSDSITLLKEQAKEAKFEADNQNKDNESYNKGQLMAYHMVISVFKQQALVFNIDQKEIGLADIDPERDLL